MPVTKTNNSFMQYIQDNLLFLILAILGIYALTVIIRKWTDLLLTSPIPEEIKVLYN
jgi:hypothetical protein